MSIMFWNLLVAEFIQGDCADENHCLIWCGFCWAVVCVAQFLPCWRFGFRHMEPSSLSLWYHRLNSFVSYELEEL